MRSKRKQTNEKDDGRAFLKCVNVVGHSVLGSQLTSEGEIIDVAGYPGDDEAIVDPAGLSYISGEAPPCNAGVASGAIYQWVGLSDLHSFPIGVVEAVTKPGQAKYHRYTDTEGKGTAARHVIHVVGPDFRERY